MPCRAHRASGVTETATPRTPAVDGVTVLRVDGGLFFANADSVRTRVRAAARADGVHAVVLDAETMPFIDVTAAQALEELTQELARDGKRLLLARDIGPVRDVLRRTTPEASDLDNVYRTVEEAVEQAGRRTGGQR